MIGAVPATWMSRPTLMARQNPTVLSYGDADAMRRRSTGLVSPPVDALRQIDAWECGHAAAAVVTRDAVATHGDTGIALRWASVTKLLSAYAGLLAAEEGIVDLDEAAGPPGATVRHLLAHTSGLPPEEGGPVARVGARRIYSNSGFDMLGALVAERAEMPFAVYVSEALAPLGTGLELRGRPAGGGHRVPDPPP